MSLCFRTRPNKFTSFVHTRKPLTKFGCRLPKYIKSTTFLEEFLGTQYIGSSTSNCKERIANTSPVYLVCQSLQNISVNTYSEWPEILNRISNRNKGKVDKSTLFPISNRDTGIHTKEILLDNNVQWMQPIVSYHAFFKNNPKNFNSYHIDMQSDRVLHNATISQSEKQQFLLKESRLDVQNTDENNSDKPSQDSSNQQLEIVYNSLKKDLPNLFAKPFNYSLYTPDVIFVNNFRGVTTNGLMSYCKQIALIRILGHLRFAYVTLEILKITMHPEDSTVKVRWRIIGIGGVKVFFLFWKLRVSKVREELESRQLWYDGFSTFYVNNEGKIYKHVVDKMMPDQDACVKTKTPIVAKLALFTGLLGLDTCSSNELCLASPLLLPRVK